MTAKRRTKAKTAPAAEATPQDEKIITYATGARRDSTTDACRLDIATPIGMRVLCIAAPISCFGNPNPFLAGTYDPAGERLQSAYDFILGFQGGERPSFLPTLPLGIAAHRLAAACDPDWLPPIQSPTPMQDTILGEHSAPWDDAFRFGVLQAAFPCGLGLIPWAGLVALGETYKEGLEKYKLNNWLKGFPCDGLLNHAVHHIGRYAGGDRSENHLGHALWNVLTAIHSYQEWPALNVGITDPISNPMPLSGA